MPRAFVRSDIITDSDTKFAALEQGIADFPQRFQTALKDDLERTVAPNLEAGLSFEPPQRKTYKFSTPKSRRWYFAQIHAGNIPTDGRNYLRSHALAKGYTVRVIANDGAVVMSARNPKWNKWVKSQRYQTIGHKINGWIPDATPINFWTERAKARIPVVARQVIRETF